MGSSGSIRKSKRRTAGNKSQAILAALTAAEEGKRRRGRPRKHPVGERGATTAPAASRRTEHRSSVVVSADELGGLNLLSDVVASVAVQPANETIHDVQHVVQHRQRHAAAADAPCTPAVNPADCIEVSVTIVQRGEDVESDLFDRMKAVCRQRAVRCMVSLERGCKEEHLHLQCVLQWPAKSPQAVTHELYRALGLSRSEFHIRSVMLKQTAFHSFEGMLGYCSKDIGQPWFRTFVKNVSEQQLRNGVDLYVAHGSAAFSKRCELNSKNILERIYVWRHHRMRYLASPSLTVILVQMMRSGRFYPSSTWALVRSTANSTLLDQAKAEAWWRMVDAPSITSIQDVETLFFLPPAQGTSARLMMRIPDSADVLTECIDPVRLLLNEIPTTDMPRTFSDGSFNVGSISASYLREAYDAEETTGAKC